MNLFDSMNLFMKRFYVHSFEGKPPSGWHLLDDHLKGTAELAKSFADAFGSGEWGYLAGLWHDLGKYRGQ
jgi:CRISPR-associated endonuclease/helicase Cas3